MTKYGFGQPIDGDIFRLNGSNSFFISDVDETIKTRLQENDIVIALPLPAGKKTLVEQDALLFEQLTFQSFDCFYQPLKDYGLAADRRDMILLPQDFSFQWIGEQDNKLALELTFTLPKGSFATSVLRELVILNDSSAPVYSEGK